LKMWSAEFDWPDRATFYDLEIEQRRNEMHEAEMMTGIALPYQRVRELKRLHALLMDDLAEEDETGELSKLWLRDYKTLGSGEGAAVEEVRRYNAAIIADVRGLLDDIAKEASGRGTKDPLQALMAVVDWSRVSNEQLHRIRSGGDILSILVNGLLSNPGSERQGSTIDALPRPEKLP